MIYRFIVATTKDKPIPTMTGLRIVDRHAPANSERVAYVVEMSTTVANRLARLGFEVRKSKLDAP